MAACGVVFMVDVCSKMSFFYRTTQFLLDTGGLQYGHSYKML